MKKRHPSPGWKGGTVSIDKPPPCKGWGRRKKPGSKKQKKGTLKDEEVEIEYEFLKRGSDIILGAPNLNTRSHSLQKTGESQAENAVGDPEGFSNKTGRLGGSDGKRQTLKGKKKKNSPRLGHPWTPKASNRKIGIDGLRGTRKWNG